MTIKNTAPEDISEIFRLYDSARSIQKTKGAVVWPEFAPSLIQAEISNKQQWKILLDKQVACVWSTTFQDPQIWEERHNDPAVYIHRIATDPLFRGRNMVGEIVKWARNYAAEYDKKFIRLDTVGENRGLITYYQNCGFEFLGLLKLKNTTGLPAHYLNATVSLFQITLD